MLSVHVMTNVPPLARSYQDGGCRIAERVGIRTIRKQANKQNKTKPTRSHQTNKKETKQNNTRQNQHGATRMEAVELRRGWVSEQ